MAPAGVLHAEKLPAPAALTEPVSATCVNTIVCRTQKHAAHALCVSPLMAQHGVVSGRIRFPTRNEARQTAFQQDGPLTNIAVPAVHAAVGGLHLVSPPCEARVPATAEAMAEADPDLVLAGARTFCGFASSIMTRLHEHGMSVALLQHARWSNNCSAWQQPHVALPFLQYV